MILATTGPAPAPVEDKRSREERFRDKVDAILAEFPDAHPDTRELLEMAKEASKPQPEGAA